MSQPHTRSETARSGASERRAVANHAVGPLTSERFTKDDVFSSRRERDPECNQPENLDPLLVLVPGKPDAMHPELITTSPACRPNSSFRRGGLFPPLSFHWCSKCKILGYQHIREVSVVKIPSHFHPRLSRQRNGQPRRIGDAAPFAFAPPADQPIFLHLPPLQSPAEKVEHQFRLQVQTCAQQDDAARALEVYAQMKSEGVNVAPYVYNMVINVCGRAEQLAAFKDGAYAAYQDMKQTSTGPKTGPTEPIYSAMVKICSKAQDFDACETIIAEMEEAKVEPKLRTFSPLLQAHSDAGHLDKCVWVHEKLLAHDLEPCEADYVALLRACVKAGDAKRFYEFLDRFIDDIWQPSLTTWNVLKEWFSSDAAQEDGRKWNISEGTVSKEGVCSVTGNQLQSLELSLELTTELLAKVRVVVAMPGSGAMCSVYDRLAGGPPVFTEI
ncbi:unnamed protein product [Phytophthora fragariaefolia]|uniref:Unnamed protein product n=1 Tax=Phytophthora fragariaefolia TaxID=1490495 RepID=A0A9W7CVR0_9STRA|nr:unnamed protein product [Phytophthora fragariaefolia]